MTAKEAAQRDILEDHYIGGLSLQLPASVLFDDEEFFKHYQDTIIDREREHLIYKLKREGKYNIVHRKPKR